MAKHNSVSGIRLKVSRRKSSTSSNRVGGTTNVGSYGGGSMGALIVCWCGKRRCVMVDICLRYCSFTLVIRVETGFVGILQGSYCMYFAAAACDLSVVTRRVKRTHRGAFLGVSVGLVGLKKCKCRYTCT